MNWIYILKVLPLFAKASLVTLELAVAGIGLSIVLGALGGTILHFRVKFLSGVIKGYIELARNTPLLIQLFFLYFGLPQIGLHWSGFTCAVIALAFLGGSYMIESFRGGLEAVSATQSEAAASLGLTPLQSFRYVRLPLAVSVSIPSLAANAIFLLKETSICGAIAIPDLLHTANDQIGMYYKTWECLILLTVFYLILILPVSFGFSALERRLRHAEFGY